MPMLSLDDLASYSDLIIYCSSNEGAVTILEVWKDTAGGIQTNDTRLLQYARRWISNQPHKAFVLFLKNHAGKTGEDESPYGFVDFVLIVGDKAKFVGPPIGTHFSMGHDKPIDYDFEEFRKLVKQFSIRKYSDKPSPH